MLARLGGQGDVGLMQVVRGTQVQGLHPGVGRGGGIEAKRPAALEQRCIGTGPRQVPAGEKRSTSSRTGCRLWAKSGRTARTQRYIRRAASVFLLVGPSPHGEARVPGRGPPRGLAVTARWGQTA